MALLGRDDEGILRLREVSGSMRMGAAHAYDQMWPGPRVDIPDNSAEEDTDSGFPSSLIPWASFHAQFNNSPIYRPNQVEEAYELWQMCRRPFGQEFDRVLHIRGLLDIEMRALRAVIEFYYMSSPRSSGSATPPPPTLESEVQPMEVQQVESIICRMKRNGEILVDREGLVWAGPLRPPSPLHTLPAEPASSSTDPLPRAPPTHRVTRRNWGTILTLTEDESNTQDPTTMGGAVEVTPHDQAIVQAAFTLYLEGYEFDWQQLKPEQQGLYHSIIGEHLRSLHEVD